LTSNVRALERHRKSLVSLERLLCGRQRAPQVAAGGGDQRADTRTGRKAPAVVSPLPMRFEEGADLLCTLDVAERDRRFGGVRVHPVDTRLPAANLLGCDEARTEVDVRGLVVAE
jgi:hypothetical protein